MGKLIEPWRGDYNSDEEYEADMAAFDAKVDAIIDARNEMERSDGDMWERRRA